MNAARALTLRPAPEARPADGWGNLDAAALAPATRTAYAGALDRMLRWLWAEGHGDRMTDATLAAYVASMVAKGAAPATVDQAIAAAATVARLEGIPSPIGPHTARRRRGMRRACAGRGRGQVVGLTWRDADRMADAAAAAGDVRGLRDAAAVALGSDAMMRVSELAALHVSDVGDATVTIRRSKTDQSARGSVHYIGPRTQQLVADYRAAAGIHEGPLLRRIRRGGHVGAEGLAAEAVRRLIVDRAAAVGIVGRISGHSLRVGAAQSLAASGATTLELQLSGRWKSERMPAHYARVQRAAVDAVARRRYGDDHSGRQPAPARVVAVCG